MNTTLLVIYASRTLAICLRYTFESIQIVDSLNNSLRHSSTLWQFVPSYGPLAASWVRLSIPDYWLRHVIDSLYVGNHFDGLWITSLPGPLMWSEVFFSQTHNVSHSDPVGFVEDFVLGIPFRIFIPKTDLGSRVSPEPYIIVSASVKVLSLRDKLMTR